MQMFFQFELQQKTRDKAGYPSLFLKAQTEKPCYLKYRILKYLGYSRL